MMIEIDVKIGNLPTDRHEEIKLVEQKKLTVCGVTTYVQACNTQARTHACIHAHTMIWISHCSLIYVDASTK